MNTYERVHADDRYALYRVRDFDIDIAGEGVLFPTGELPGSKDYAVASIHCVGELSTADFTVIVSNEDEPEIVLATTHPDDADLWAANVFVTRGFAIEHLHIGVRVATAQASTKADIYLLLRP